MRSAMIFAPVVMLAEKFYRPVNQGVEHARPLAFVKQHGTGGDAPQACSARELAEMRIAYVAEQIDRPQARDVIVSENHGGPLFLRSESYVSAARGP